MIGAPPLLYAISQPHFLLLDLVKEENASNQAMKTSIAAYVTPCPVCQRNKAEHLSLVGLLQPLALPTQVWANISMDFIEGLPLSSGKSTLFVVVDRFSKYAHFIPMAHPYTTSRHELLRLCGTKLKFSSSYHPQTDGQTKSTPFSILYGRDPPRLLSYTLASTRVDSIDQALIELDQVQQNISDCLLKAQVRMKDFYDKGHRDIRANNIINILQSTLGLSLLFDESGQSPINCNVAQLHDVLYVSLLKPFKGPPPSAIPSLPPMDNGQVILTSAMVFCAHHFNDQWEILVHWKDTKKEDATWQQLANFEQIYPSYELEDKLLLHGRADVEDSIAHRVTQRRQQ
ncbi:uncharacterized protein [Aristolochia californica]|uniref:uncharacterized protein n=1 Tax=Aristolochia californica TaxID=171875 RepID=UPI0035DD1E04